jgi:hypothetical protein
MRKAEIFKYVIPAFFFVMVLTNYLFEHILEFSNRFFKWSRYIILYVVIS